jgi:methylenetetrahydrofolate dehydrogenase (NADP+) / methenyltetrahydrofolate cyclohydrolase
MTANIIDGKYQSQVLNETTKKQVLEIQKKHNFTPCLAVILVGEDPASQVYVRNKVKTAGDIGIKSLEFIMPADTSQEELEQKVKSLSEDENIDGILVQLPLPKHLNEDAVIEKIDPLKDVDGLTEKSAGKLSLGKIGLRACTPSGSVILAKSALGNDLTGLNVLVIGRSILVGKPAALLFLEENCTVTIAHSKTKNLAYLCSQADILVAAVGRPLMVKGEWVKEGSCVIDVGINRVENTNPQAKSKTKLVGDVDFETAKEIAGFISPVPGGVGPMTIACLMSNTIIAAKLRRNII